MTPSNYKEEIRERWYEISRKEAYEKNKVFGPLLIEFIEYSADFFLAELDRVVGEEREKVLEAKYGVGMERIIKATKTLTINEIRKRVEEIQAVKCFFGTPEIYIEKAKVLALLTNKQ